MKTLIFKTPLLFHSMTALLNRRFKLYYILKPLNNAFDNCNIASCCMMHLSKAIERIPKRAVKIIIPCFHCTEGCFKDFELVERRQNLSENCQEISKGEHLSSNLPLPKKNKHAYRTRDWNSLTLFKCKSERFCSSISLVRLVFPL